MRIIRTKLKTALKKLVEGGEKEKGVVRFQKQFHARNEWLRKNREKARGEFKKALEQLTDEKLEATLKNLLSHATFAWIKLDIEYRNGRYLTLHPYLDKSLLDEYTKLDIADVEIVKWETIGQWFKKILTDNGFNVSIVDPANVRSRGSDDDNEKDCLNNLAWYISWAQLPWYYGKNVNWVEVYDLLQLYLFHNRMYNSLVDYSDELEVFAEYHEKRCEECGEELLKIMDCEYSDVNDLITPYEEEINKWLDKYTKGEYNGKELPKKLKLTDPTKLDA